MIEDAGARRRRIEEAAGICWGQAPEVLVISPRPGASLFS